MRFNCSYYNKVFFNRLLQASVNMLYILQSEKCLKSTQDIVVDGEKHKKHLKVYNSYLQTKRNLTRVFQKSKLSRH